MTTKKPSKKPESSKKPLIVKESYFIKSFKLAKSNPGSICFWFV